MRANTRGGRGGRAGGGWGRGRLFARETPSVAARAGQAWWVGNVTWTAQGYSYASVNLPAVKFDRCFDGDLTCDDDCPQY